MNDRIRVSDADREHVAGRLREHFAAGRLTPDELDERVTVALSARTAGDLRRVLADLPEPGPAAPPPPPGRAAPPWAGWPPAYRHRGPRLWPLVLVALIALLVLPAAGWLFVAFLKVVLVLWLVACLAGLFAAMRFRRRARRIFHGWYGRGIPWPGQYGPRRQQGRWQA